MTTAYIIQAAQRANLILSGVDEDGDLEWLGTRSHHDEFRRLTDFHEKYGRFPNDDYPYREQEPHVFTK